MEASPRETTGRVSSSSSSIHSLIVLVFFFRLGLRTLTGLELRRAMPTCAVFSARKVTSHIEKEVCQMCEDGV